MSIIDFYVHYFSEPRAAMAAGLEDAVNISLAYAFTAPMVDEWDGCWAVRVDFAYEEGYVEERYYVMTDAPSTSPMPVAYFTSGATALQMQREFNEGESESPTWEELYATFNAIYPGFIVEFVETACGATAVEGDAITFLDADALLGVSSSAISIKAQNNVVVISCTLYGFLWDPEIGIATFPQMFRTSPVAPVQVTGSQIDTARIAEALEDIAAQDYEIGLNNGQSIFRVRGKATITGPEGGGG